MLPAEFGCCADETIAVNRSSGIRIAGERFAVLPKIENGILACLSIIREPLPTGM
jgi:hypothetical protein